MGWVHATSPCVFCKRTFSYNPHRVPSTSALTGTREPICGFCFRRINDLRVRDGLEPLELASDAYQSIPEEDL